MGSQAQHVTQATPPNTGYRLANSHSYNTQNRLKINKKNETATSFLPDLLLPEHDQRPVILLPLLISRISLQLSQQLAKHEPKQAKKATAAKTTTSSETTVKFRLPV